MGDKEAGEQNEERARPDSGEVMKHSPKVIQPSAEFESEMAKENQSGSAEGGNAGISEPSTSGAGDDTMDAQPPAESVTTPQAVQDFINSGDEHSIEQPISQTTPSLATITDVKPPAQPTAEIPTDTPTTAVSADSQPVSAGGDQIADNIHPVTGQPLVPSEPPQKAKKRWLWPSVITVVVIIILVLLWLFLLYLPNTPSAVYSSSLERTGQAVDKLIAYSQNDGLSQYQSDAVTGSIQANGKNYNFDGNLKGNYDENGNTSTNFGIDSKTQGDTNHNIKAELNLLTLEAAGDSYPDVYFKLTGIGSILDALGASSDSPLGKYDGQWIEISHSLIKNFADQYAGQSTTKSKLTSPTKAQIFDAINKVQAVNKQYVFTDSPQTAVLVKKAYVGAETKYGRSVYHYKMGYNKAHLLAYVQAVGDALDSSGLNSWSQANFKKNLSDEVNISSMKKQIQKNAKPGYTFDMWADRKTKLVEAVQFQDNQKNDTSSITFAQTYDGGEVYPFRVDITGDDHGDKESLSAMLNVDSVSHKVALNFNFIDNNQGNKSTVVGNLAVTPSSAHVKVTAPKNAEPLEKVLSELGLGGLLAESPETSGNSAGASSNSSSSAAKDANTESIAAMAQAKVEEYAADQNGEYPSSQQALDSWLADPNGGNNKTLASEFTTADGFTYTKASGRNYVITYKLSSGKVVTLNQ